MEHSTVLWVRRDRRAGRPTDPLEVDATDEMKRKPIYVDK
jgi:hypothetical protein